MTRGDIVEVDLPQPKAISGREQFGQRPGLVVHDDSTANSLSVIMIVPLTSNPNAARFPHTVGVQPSATNGLQGTARAVRQAFDIRLLVSVGMPPRRVAICGPSSALE